MPKKHTFNSIDTNIKKKGFRLEEGDHHYYTYYTMNNHRTRIKTKMSHCNRGNTVIGDTLLGFMAKQCHLNKKDFYSFIECTLSQEEYELKLMNIGLIDDHDMKK